LALLLRATVFLRRIPMPQLSARYALHLADGTADKLPGSVEIEHADWRAEARRLGATVIVSVTASDPRAALEQLVTSDQPMDCWFKDSVRSLTGADLPVLFA
jgi:hypothetical protein